MTLLLTTASRRRRTRPVSTSLLWPNEPAGFTKFAEYRADVLPLISTYANAVPGPGRHRWEQGSYAGGSPAKDNTATSDPSRPNAGDAGEPMSPPDYLQMKFPNQWGDGSAPGSFSLWDSNGYGASGRKKKLYIGMIFRWVGQSLATPGPVEVQRVGIKHFFLAFGKGATNHAQSFLILQGNFASPALFSARKFRWVQQGHIASWAAANDPSYPLEHIANDVTGSVVKLNPPAWNRFEGLWEVNSAPDVPDGSFQAWNTDMTNAPTVVQRTHAYIGNTIYTTTGNTEGLLDWTGDPTWGGNSGDVKSQDDWLQYGHVYMSGVPE